MKLRFTKHPKVMEHFFEEKFYYAQKGGGGEVGGIFGPKSTFSNFS